MAQHPSLADRPGGHGCVELVDVPDAHRRRLAELGLRPGAHIEIVQRTAGGGIVVGVGGGRIALDQRTAQRITLTGAA